MSPDQPMPPGKLLMRRTLRLGSGLLACATLLDLAREGFSGGSWRAFPGLGQAYGMVLAAYAATREWEKWADPQDEASYGGHWYLLAWIILPVLLWLADITNLVAVSWPDSLNSTLSYVMAAYLGSKASARWRGLTRGTFARARLQAPVQGVLTTDQLLTRHVLRIGAMLLGAVCLWDAAVEGFSVGEWTFTGGIYASYGLVLGAYSATREWEKWTDPIDQDAYWGNWFVLAWCVLPAVLWLVSAMGAATVWPANMNAALATVLGVFTGCKASGLWRASKVKEGWGKAPGGPDPGPGLPMPDVPAKPVDKVAAACRKRAPGTFTAAQIAADIGMDADMARSYIGQLIGDHLIRKEGKGLYRWIGPT